MSDPKEYFDDQRQWARDTVASDRKSRRLAWAIAVVALGLAAIQSFVLLAILPLKTKETVTLLVDRTTGFTEVLDPNGAKTIRADEALTQSLLAQYVVSRERLDPGLVNRDYRKTALWSSGAARQTYLGRMAQDNPESPIRGLNPNQKTHIDIKSVSQLSPGQALVRFDTFRESTSGQKERVDSWISAMRYTFIDAPMSFDDRLLNPLGFQVSSYRRDPERPGQGNGPAAQVADFAPETSTLPIAPLQNEMELIE